MMTTPGTPGATDAFSGGGPTGTTRRSAIARYGLWQLRDYAVERGASTLIVISLFAALSLVPMLALLRQLGEQPNPAMIARYGSMAAAIAARRHQMSVSFLGGYLGVAVYMGALFAMQGIVAHDRSKGYFRFLFAKPVAPSRYYGQAFWVHAAGFMMLMTVLALVYGRYVERVLTFTLLAGLVATWCCYAGIAFLFSALLKFDWIGLVVVTLVASLAWARWSNVDSVLRAPLYLLPPLHRTDEVYHAMASGGAMPWSLVAWLGGYGLLCYLLALVVLRHRRLAIP